MSRKEDQDLEIEALQSIYPDELTLKNSSPYEIDLSLLPNSATGAEGPNHVGVTLQISFPEDYPDVAPTILVRKDLGLGDKDVLPALDKVIAETAAENAGVAMVYSIAERVRDWLREHNEPEGSGSAYDEMMKKQRQKAKAEAAATAAASGGGAAYDPSAPSGGRGGKISAALDAEEALRKKREGTQVTMESFLAWRAKFEAEMAEKKRKEEEERIAAGGLAALSLIDPVTGKMRLTGKQMFEADSSLATSDAAAFGTGADEEDAIAGSAGAAAAGGAGSASSAAAVAAEYKIDMSLFAEDEGLDDLPSDEDEDDDDEDDSDFDDEEDEDDDEEYTDDDDDEDYEDGDIDWGTDSEEEAPKKGAAAGGKGGAAAAGAGAKGKGSAPAAGGKGAGGKAAAPAPAPAKGGAGGKGGAAGKKK